MQTRDIKKKYKIASPVDRVWNAVTINEVLIQWMADKVTGRPILGEKFSWSWSLGDEGEFTTIGIYSSISPGKSIGLKWIDHPAGEIELMLEFFPDENNTILEITNSGYPLSSKFDLFFTGAGAGWDDQIERLQNFLINWNGIVPPKKALIV